MWGHASPPADSLKCIACITSDLFDDDMKVTKKQRAHAIEEMSGFKPWPFWVTVIGDPFRWLMTAILEISRLEDACTRKIREPRSGRVKMPFRLFTVPFVASCCWGFPSTFLFGPICWGWECCNASLELRVCLLGCIPTQLLAVLFEIPTLKWRPGCGWWLLLGPLENRWLKMENAWTGVGGEGLCLPTSATQ